MPAGASAGFGGSPGSPAAFENRLQRLLGRRDAGERQKAPPRRGLLVDRARKLGLAVPAGPRSERGSEPAAISACERRFHDGIARDDAGPVLGDAREARDLELRPDLSSNRPSRRVSSGMQRRRSWSR